MQETAPMRCSAALRQQRLWFELVAVKVPLLLDEILMEGRKRPAWACSCTIADGAAGPVLRSFGHLSLPFMGMPTLLTLPFLAQPPDLKA